MLLAAGCDAIEQDPDGQLLSINNDPAYFLPGSDGYIDLASRIVSPGSVRMEITGSTRNGVLKDLGKGLLQYTPSGKNSRNDSFQFRVLSNDNKILGEDSIGIIIPTDTTNLPCAGVFTRPDSARNVTGPVTIDVIANDYSCLAALSVTINVAPEHGTATIVGNKIQYTPGASFAGRDNLLYKAATSDPLMPAGYGMLRITGLDSVSNPNCTPVAIDDLFPKPKNDTTAIFLNVLVNDTVCDSVSTLAITSYPSFGTAWVDNNLKKIKYRNAPTTNFDDTLRYKFCGPGGCATAKAIIKRQ
jgi:hypothetical protein